MKNLFTPDYRFGSLYDIQPDFYRRENIRLLILDIDNTLVAHGAPYDERAGAYLHKLQEAGVCCCILSNNRQRRVAPFATDSGLYAFPRAGKPKKRGYLALLRRFNVASTEVAAVGDQLFTDILGANRAGIRTILVDPLDLREPAFIRLKRRLERWFFGRR